MKTPTWMALTAAFLIPSTLSHSVSLDPLPFDHPITASPDSNRRAYEALQELNKRDGDCPLGYDACNNLDNPGICCRADSVCTSDEANHIACCPSSASCTGTLSGSSSGGFQFPTATPTSDDDDDDDEPSHTLTGSTLDGAYPFLVVPTTFSDADQCSSYYDRCEEDYTKCITHMGGGYGVTVTGGGADFTQAGGGSGAVATCSSLSREACHGLNLGVCGNYEGGTDGAACRSGRTSSLQDLVMGVVVGVAGFFI
ncbi:hypothetical protein BJY04DRAFT_204043 [Aspergillus karnatakaensis]|uniref:uncharacterized protein n=1 Tax=Aspergillus karnatakaensis TaxID=1810916 RepID=UPI003CCD79F8